jgi:hypothetical protein
VRPVVGTGSCVSFAALDHAENFIERRRMDGISRVRIRLTLDDLSDRARRSIINREQVLVAEHAALRLLKSGAFIKAMAKVVDEETHRFLDLCVTQIATIERGAAAFSLIDEEVRSYVTFAEGRFQHVVKIASDPSPGDGSWNAAIALFEALRTSVFRQLELRRFEFAADRLPSAVQTAVPPSDASAHAPVNRGGKPMAAHWDDLWSEICARLYNGDLKPNTQADIEAAMSDWAALQDVSVGATAIKERARRLWRKIVKD